MKKFTLMAFCFWAFALMPMLPALAEQKYTDEEAAKIIKMSLQKEIFQGPLENGRGSSGPLFVLLEEVDELMKVFTQKQLKPVWDMINRLHNIAMENPDKMGNNLSFGYRVYSHPQNPEYDLNKAIQHAKERAERGGLRSITHLCDAALKSGDYIAAYKWRLVGNYLKERNPQIGFRDRFFPDISMAVSKLTSSQKQQAAEQAKAWVKLHGDAFAEARIEDGKRN